MKTTEIVNTKYRINLAMKGAVHSKMLLKISPNVRLADKAKSYCAEGYTQCM
jgi:hypothetical protein